MKEGILEWHGLYQQEEKRGSWNEKAFRKILWDGCKLCTDGNGIECEYKLHCFPSST